VAVSRIRGLLDNRWIGLIVICFAVVYAASLTFGYIEGDDASSMAYHVYGRDSSIQPPYSPYHSMMDRVLGLLPSNETLLRTVGIALTSIAAVALVLFMLAIIFDWLKSTPLAPRWIIALAVLLASPEFFYLGLVYIPGVIAMALVLAAHLILRLGRQDAEPPDWRTNRGRAALIVSAVIFGLGAACRWDITVYGAVIAADLVFGYGSGRLLDLLRRRWRLSLGWGLLALLSFGAALFISGYSPATAVAEFQKYQSFLGERSQQITETIGSIQPLVTPAFGLFALVGVIVLIRRRSALLIVFAVGLIAVLPWAMRGVPKFILPGVPSMVACAVVGFSTIWTQFKPERWQQIARLGVAALLVAPWLVGVRVLYDDSAFGPGFEVRAYDRPLPEGFRVSLAPLGAGTLFPTSEGPRGLFGHAAVLLGGGWRDATQKSWEDVTTAVDYAIQHDVPLVSTGNISNFVIALWQRGYKTTDPRDPPGFVSGDLVERTFSNADADTVVIFRREIPTTQIGRLDALPADIEEIVIFGYPRTMRKLYLDAPDTLLEKLGTDSALLDLAQLRNIIAQTAKS
jgi:hypothetical protein